jgi:hypothetical protein
LANCEKARSVSVYDRCKAKPLWKLGRNLANTKLLEHHFAPANRDEVNNSE